MNNNQDNSAMFGVAVVCAGFFLLMIVVYAFAAFVALLLTILCLCAWNKPFEAFGEELYPEQARAFVGAGIVGGIGIPAFALFCELLFDFRVDEELWPHIVIAGYTFASLASIPHLIEEEEKQKAARMIDVAPQFNYPPLILPEPEPEPFEFANWSDEFAGFQSPNSEPCQGCNRQPDSSRR